MASSTKLDGARPLISIVTFDGTAMFNDLYEGFIRTLATKAEVERITTPDEARNAFNKSPRPKAILSADASFTVSTRTALVQEALGYVQAGGVLVFMGLFSSFARPSDIGHLFSSLDLPWHTGDYHRSTFERNPSMTHFDITQLPPRYSQKALHLDHVAREDAVYLPTDSSHIESLVFPPSSISNLRQTPIALAKVEQGMVGYVGDVNNETETTASIRMMCDLEL